MERKGEPTYQVSVAGRLATLEQNVSNMGKEMKRHEQAIQELRGNRCSHFQSPETEREQKQVQRTAAGIQERVQQQLAMLEFLERAKQSEQQRAVEFDTLPYDASCKYCALMNRDAEQRIIEQDMKLQLQEGTTGHADFLQRLQTVRETSENPDNPEPAKDATVVVCRNEEECRQYLARLNAQNRQLVQTVVRDSSRLRSC